MIQEPDASLSFYKFISNFTAMVSSKEPHHLTVSVM